MRSLGSYNLALSQKPASSHGWPELQAQVLVKLAATCRPQSEIYVRILLTILENFSEVLSMTEKEELLKSVTDLIARLGPPRGSSTTKNLCGYTD